MLESFKTTSQVAEVIQTLLLGISEFYDKNPIVTSIGFLAITTIWPLKVVLNHFYKIKQEDNRHIRDKMQYQLRKAQLGIAASKSKGDS